MSFQVKKYNSILASLINWMSGATSRVTDYNKGSVVRTILESFAMELEELYYQLLQATQEAIEEAIYRAFNFPKNPAEKSTGAETFTRLSGIDVVVTIPQGTLVATDTDPPVLFETEADDTIPYKTGTGTGGNETKLIDINTDFLADLGLTDESQLVGALVKDVTGNGEATVLTVSQTTNPNDTLNLTTLTNGATFVSGTHIYKVIVLSKNVSIRATTAGILGNVAAGAVMVLRTNVPNVQSVTNPSAIINGQDEESDTSRKTRFSLYIQSLARATRGALEYAAKSVPTVVAAKAVDDVRPVVLVHDDSEGTYTDISVYMTHLTNPATPGLTELFPDDLAVGDSLLVGGSEVFNSMNINLTSFGIVAGTAPAWKYYSETGWKPLTTTDNTNKLQQSGTVSWVVPGDWVEATFGGVSRLWVELIVYATPSYSVIPFGDYISLPPGFGCVYLYCHDGSGDLSDTLKAQIENVVELYRGCGIVVVVSAPTKTDSYVTFELKVAPNYDGQSITDETVQTVINHVNSKALGEDLYVSELYRLIMDSNSKAILNVIISLPTSDILIPSSAVLRTDASKITATYIQ